MAPVLWGVGSIYSSTLYQVLKGGLKLDLLVPGKKYTRKFRGEDRDILGIFLLSSTWRPTTVPGTSCLGRVVPEATVSSQHPNLSPPAQCSLLCMCTRGVLVQVQPAVEKKIGKCDKGSWGSDWRVWWLEPIDFRVTSLSVFRFLSPVNRTTGA